MANYGTRYEKHKTPYGVLALLLIPIEYIMWALSGLFVIEGASLENFNESLSWALQHPRACYNDNTIVLLACGVVAWLFFVVWYTYNYRDFHLDSEHGDATWLDPYTANNELADKDDHYNRIVSGNVKVSLRGSLSNNNMLVIGSSGSYKTTSVMHQNLLQHTGSYVVLDVKGDTQRKLGKAMQEAGYEIRSLNFKNPEKSDRYNPFTFIEREDDLLRAIKALHQAARPKQEASSADPFWDDAVDLYLQSLFYYAWLQERWTGKKGTLNDVVYLTQCESRTVPGSDPPVTELQQMMDDLAERMGDDYPPVRDYRKLKNGAPDTVASVILMINSMLSICDTAEVRRIFEDNDIDIRDLGRGAGEEKKPVCLFLVIPDNNSVYTWIVSMFYTQMFDILIRLSDDELHAPLPYQVEMHMDEFYAGAKPADADVLLGVIRSRNISMIPYLQSISQLKTLYKDTKWETIMDNVATVLYLGSGPAAHSTHEFISNLLDSATADSRDESMSSGRNASGSTSFKRTEIKLMRPNQVAKMPATDCIIFFEGHPPVYDEKAIPFDQPAKFFTAQKWLKERYSNALGLGPYEHPVHTIYDPVHFRYMTFNEDKRVQIVYDRKDIETLHAAAKKDKSIYEYTIDSEELLYLSWGAPKKGAEEIEKIYRKAVAENPSLSYNYRGMALKVMQEINDLESAQLQEPDEDNSKIENAAPEQNASVSSDEPIATGRKSGWDARQPFRTLLKDHWAELSKEEQETICIAIDDDLTERQLAYLICLPEEKMDQVRRSFVLQNAAEAS